MFKIISIMFVGLGAGYLLRDLKLMRKTEKTIPLTVFAMLFILGISVGSNNLIVSNLGRFSGQAALLACFSVLGSIIAAWLVYYLFLGREENDERKYDCLFVLLLGCLIGFGAHIQLDTHNLSMYILYVLMFQVGINIGSNENLKGMLAHFTPKMLIIPLGTIVGTLLFRR